MRFGDLFLCRCRLVAVGRQQPGQQTSLEIVEAHRLERLIRRVRRAAAGVVAAVRLDDLGDHRRPTVRRGWPDPRCRLQQIQQQPGASRRRPPAADPRAPHQCPRRPRSPSSRPAPPETTGRTSRRRCSRWSGRRSNAHARPSRSTSRSPRPSTDITRPASTVSDGPTEIPCARSASTNPTRWPGSPCGRQGLRGAGIVRDGHQFSLKLTGGPQLVGLVFEDHAERGGDRRVVDGVHAQRQHGAAPVDGLGDRRHLLELHAAQHADDADQFLGELLRAARAPGTAGCAARVRRRGSRCAGTGSGA